MKGKRWFLALAIVAGLAALGPTGFRAYRGVQPEA